LSGSADPEESSSVDLSRFIRDIPDFPKKGIMFKDITPLLADADALHAATEAMAAPWQGRGIRKVAGLEARGFIFGPLIAARLTAGFVPIRKAGKLPAATLTEEYDLEYGTDRIEIHEDAVGKQERVLLVDDLLATGGTAAAAVSLLGRTGAEVAGLSLLVELDFLKGRGRLPGLEVTSILHY
jgi:adenine phosphoribosyltransferase